MPGIFLSHHCADCRSLSPAHLSSPCLLISMKHNRVGSCRVFGFFWQLFQKNLIYSFQCFSFLKGLKGPEGFLAISSKEEQKQLSVFHPYNYSARSPLLSEKLGMKRSRFELCYMKPVSLRQATIGPGGPFQAKKTSQEGICLSLP